MFRNQVFGKNKIMMCGNSRYVELKEKSDSEVYYDSK